MIECLAVEAFVYCCLKFYKLGPRLSKDTLFMSYYGGPQTVVGFHLNKVFLFQLWVLLFIGKLINILKYTILLLSLGSGDVIYK